MAKVTVTDIDAGAELTAESMNATIESWNTNSTDIDDENVREEGIDRRNIASNAATTNPTSSASTINSNATLRNLKNSSPTIYTVFHRIGPFTYDSTDQSGMKVTCSFEYETELFGTPSSTHTTTTAPRYHFRLAYSTDGSSFTSLDHTEREAGPGIDDLPTKGSMTISHVFTAITGSTSTLYFALEVWEDGANHSAVPGSVAVQNFNLFAVRVLR